MIKIIVKKSCGYCDVLKETLEDFGVPFETQQLKSGVAPRLYKDGKLIFTGLPHMLTLLNFLNEEI